MTSIPMNQPYPQNPMGQPYPQQHLAPGLPLVYEYRGSTIGDILNSILAGLLVCVTVGLALPWAVVIRHRWVCEHTYVNGQQMRFTGKGMDLAVKWLIWWLLTIVTFGIYGFVVNNRMRKWVIEHQTAVVPVLVTPPVQR